MQVVAAGPEQWAEDQDPAHQQQRGRDHQPVQHLADPPNQAAGGEGQAEQGGRGQRDRGQVADVGQRREGHVAAQDRLVPGPGGLPAAPGQRRGSQQLPHPPVLCSAATGGDQAGDPRRGRRGDQPKVGNRLSRLGATHTQHQARQPQQGQGRHGGAFGRKAALGWK